MKVEFNILIFRISFFNRYVLALEVTEVTKKLTKINQYGILLS